MKKYEQFGTEYQELANDIYTGIYKAHPKITKELADEYARIAFYMIRKNKIQPCIHAPKKSYSKFKILLTELKESGAIDNNGKVDIDSLRKIYTKKSKN